VRIANSSGIQRLAFEPLDQMEATTAHGTQGEPLLALEVS
jgi:hypothetical protein